MSGTAIHEPEHRFQRTQENLYLEMLLESTEPVGRMYYPDKWEGVNVYYALKDQYFDDLESIEIAGDLGEIPANENNVVY